MGPVGCSETSITDNHSTLPNMTEEQRSHAVPEAWNHATQAVNGSCNIEAGSCKLWCSEKSVCIKYHVWVSILALRTWHANQNCTFLRCHIWPVCLYHILTHFFIHETIFEGKIYRGADKSLARPGRKQATATKLWLLLATQKKKNQKVVRPTRFLRQQWPPRRTKNGEL